MSSTKPLDSDYAYRRWKKEVAQAQQAGDRRAKAAHNELAERYAEKIDKEKT
ncbi:hypothetical protein [Parasphingopyxis marina]|uniref:Uncharacterized protein n=1 Tax=Parasphingopyxis marina TaxID=2761622 RepID=A0A842HS09_9SPHN|nr:hypothetical protein [Parasphingopyxis marina]MBC2776618.1 hypothetical protein [Parasphingopyxis marina]